MERKMLTSKYKDKITGVISCYDRIIIQGNLPGWCFAEGMTKFLNVNNIRIFDYPKFAQQLNEEIRANTEDIAAKNNIEIEFIRKSKEFRKESRIKEILKKRGGHIGLVHIFSAMETCNNYKPWHDKKSGKTFLKYDTSKCLHYYVYFIDKEFGLCYLRVPTWCPFRLQFYFNGHNRLANKLNKSNIEYTMIENAFLSIKDFEKAQELSDKLRVEDLHQALDIFAQKYCPIIKKYDIQYHWSIMQVEYSTDIIFRRQDELQPLYETLIRTAIHSVKPENIASFLGRKVHTNYQGEMGNNFNTRILGTRIKHQMGAVSIKMYDKFGIVLRIETTVNNVSEFKHFRDVQPRNGNTVQKVAPMKKNIYSLFPLANILKSCNRRYLEFISTFDDPSDGIKYLKTVSETVELSNRSYKGFNFFSKDDQKLFEVISRGEFNINGFKNKSIRKYLSDKSSSSISRIIQRLKTHGLIKKVAHTYKYYLTKLGKTVIATGLTIKHMFVIPNLANCY